jgi:hypothetical protein
MHYLADLDLLHFRLVLQRLLNLYSWNSIVYNSSIENFHQKMHFLHQRLFQKLHLETAPIRYFDYNLQQTQPMGHR